MTSLNTEGSCELLLLELYLVELGIESATLEQLCVGALLDDLSLLHDADEVGVHDRGEAVGNDDGGAVADEMLDSLLD